MKHLIFFLLFLGYTQSLAQDCDKNQLKTLPGKWLPQPADSYTGKLSATDMAGAKKVLDQIQKLFREKYKPVGMDTYDHYHYIKGDDDNKNIYGNPAMYTIRNFQFICSDGKKKTAAEGVGSFVYINSPGLFGDDFNEIPLFDERGKLNENIGFNTLSPINCPEGKLPDFSDGYHIVDGGYYYSVWIAYEGKQPFRYVSRKEFLQKQVAIYEEKLKDLNKHYSSALWKEQLEKNPESRERILDDMKKILAVYELPLQDYRNDLKKDAAWLNEMAIVNFLIPSKPGSKTNYFRYNFTTLDDPYMLVPYMPNPDYYNRNLPKWVPQFIRIQVRYYDYYNTFISINVRKVVDENIDFFKSLLGNQK